MKISRMIRAYKPSVQVWCCVPLPFPPILGALTTFVTQGNDTTTFFIIFQKLNEYQRATGLSGFQEYTIF